MLCIASYPTNIMQQILLRTRKYTRRMANWTRNLNKRIMRMNVA